MIKHSYNENGSKWLRIGPDVTSSNSPALTYGNDDIRPYWKSHGTGRENLIIEQWGDDLLLRAINEGEEGKGRKETWIHLDKETAAKIGAFLQGRAVPAEAKQ